MDAFNSDFFYPDFDLREFRHRVASYVKLLIRARWKSDPGFLSESDLQRWKLTNIAEDSNPAWQSMHHAALALGELNTNFLPRCGSGGVKPTDESSAVGRLIDAVAFLAYCSGGGPHHNGALLGAADSLKQDLRIDWESLVNWNQLPSIRDDLDLLPNFVSPTSKVAPESRPGSRLCVTLSFPQGTQWKDISLVFLSKETVRITGPEFSKRFMFSELGFVDRRRGETPDSRWDTLRYLAQQRGILSWETTAASKQKNCIQAAISEIRRRLKRITGLDEDPFEDYRTCRAYRTKFTIRDNSFSGESDSSNDSAD